MLQGKIRAAMRWLTERSQGSVFLPNNQVTIMVDGMRQQVPVTEALKLKYPQSHPPHSSIHSLEIT